MLITLTFLAAFYLPINTPSAKADTQTESAWTTLAPMPTGRGAFGLAVVNGKIYAIGGINGDNTPLSVVEEYNPVLNQWTVKTPMPTPRSGFAVAVYSGKIYAIGGNVGNVYLGNNEVYDPATNTWATKASMPTPRADLSASIVDDGIYLIGGKRYSSTNPYYVETNINERYNPADDTWSTRTPILTGVQGYGSAVIDNKIYVIGGSRQTASGTTTVVNNNAVYDAGNDEWSLTTPITSLVSYGAAAATAGYMAPQGIYFVGGFTGNQVSSQTKLYHPSNNSWRSVDSMPTAREYLGLVVINDILYAMGGFDGTSWLSANEQYKPVGYGTVPPRVQITSPENRTYQEVSLAFTVNRGVEWMAYSLDGRANISIASEAALFGLSQGSHYITVYANDSSGNVGVSNTVYFSIDSIAPEIVIIQPGNQSYGATDIQLTFTVNEAVTSLSYSLDGQANVPIVGNVTLVALSNGPHRVTVYATDDIGNAAQETVYFNIAPFPILAVIAALTILIIVIAAAYIVWKHKKGGQTTSSKPTA